MSEDESRRIWKRKKKCTHDTAKSDGNSDWPGLICTKCGKQIPEDEEKNYE